MTASENLKKLNIELPKAADPVGAYVAFKIIGKLIFISGQLPIMNDGKLLKGKIGKDLSLEDGQKAAKFCAINILAQANKAVAGDLNKIKNCVKITGFVNSTDEFIDQPKVINGFSDLIVDVFGDRGLHARSAVGMASLPREQAVEVEMIVEVRD